MNFRTYFKFVSELSNLFLRRFELSNIVQFSLSNFVQSFEHCSILGGSEVRTF
nr:MAG TPA: hypothetical protein [Caudoviricetes sp.]